MTGNLLDFKFHHELQFFFLKVSISSAKKSSTSEQRKGEKFSGNKGFKFISFNDALDIS